MSQSIISLKLVTGEEIIAHCSDTTADWVTISQPRQILMQQTAPGQMGIGMIPWFASAGDKEIKIWRNTVVASMSDDEIVDALLKNYIQQTSALDLSSTASSLIKGK